MINRMKAIRKRGFNLIESAIVLGVVGLVVGGIWSAASAVMENQKIQKTIQDFVFISNNMQNLISIRDGILIGAGVSLKDFAISTSAVPSDWVQGTNLKSSFGAASIGNYLSDFQIVVLDVPRSACIKLVVETSTMISQKRSGANLMSVNWSVNWSTTTFPVSLSTAEIACNQSSNAFIIVYPYTRNN